MILPVVQCQKTSVRYTCLFVFVCLFVLRQVYISGSYYCIITESISHFLWDFLLTKSK